MVQVVNRAVIAASGSFQVSLPIDWARRHRVKGGDTLTVITNDVVVILPPHPLDKNDIRRALEDAASMAIISQSDIRPVPPKLLEDK